MDDLNEEIYLMLTIGNYTTKDVCLEFDLTSEEVNEIYARKSKRFQD